MSRRRLPEVPQRALRDYDGSEHVPAIWRRLKLRRAIGQTHKCTLTQQEANALSEELPMNMPNLCAGLMKTYLLSLMYAPVLPVGLLIGLVAAFLQYWVNKYMLLRRHSRPVHLSDELDEVMLQFIALGCAAYAASTYYFYYDLDYDLFLPGAIACGLVAFYICTPFQRMLKICLRKQLLVTNVASLSETTKTYDESAVDFFTDSSTMVKKRRTGTYRHSLLLPSRMFFVKLLD